MMESKISVHTGRGYEILIGRGIRYSAAELILPLFPNAERVCVVSDSNVAPLYADALLDALRRAGLSVFLFVFPAGEQSKTLATVGQMYAHFAAHRLTRTDFAIALGGGVTGDLCGFAAATYLRGINFVQMPTSLLAQVDSSVGGKTGVDLPEGKNLVGAFWQPRLVLIDPDVLQTLSPLFYADGMAEIIKTACIKDAALFERLNQETPPPIEETIADCVVIKAGVVERDEREAGERTLLNFGHTVGHALEKLHGYCGLTHGHAVAVGMAELNAAAEQAGLTEPGCTRKLRLCLARYGLPDTDPASAAEIAAAAAGDKKTTGSKIKLVLLRRIGESYIYPATLDELEQLLAKAGGTQK
ncbi:MAG: 3-dehydroquinate synthase [Acutalibacteraceae bacterium]|jgi:3-dehydroquinate synthase